MYQLVHLMLLVKLSENNSMQLHGGKAMAMAMNARSCILQRVSAENIQSYHLQLNLLLLKRDCTTKRILVSLPQAMPAVLLVMKVTSLSGRSQESCSRISHWRKWNDALGFMIWSIFWHIMQLSMVEIWLEWLRQSQSWHYGLRSLILYHEVMWGWTKTQMQDFEAEYDCAKRPLMRAIHYQKRKELECRVKWPMYASYEEDAKLRAGTGISTLKLDIVLSCMTQQIFLCPIQVLEIWIKLFITSITTCAVPKQVLQSSFAVGSLGCPLLPDTQQWWPPDWWCKDPRNAKGIHWEWFVFWCLIPQYFLTRDITNFWTRLGMGSYIFSLKMRTINLQVTRYSVLAVLLLYDLVMKEVWTSARCLGLLKEVVMITNVILTFSVMCGKLLSFTVSILCMIIISSIVKLNCKSGINDFS